MSTFYIRRQNELYHHGIKGQRWGIRRYQNEDGTLTPEGRKHYGIEGLDSSRRNFKSSSQAKREYIKESKELNKKLRKGNRKLYDEAYDEAEKEANQKEVKCISDANKNKQFVSDWKKAAKRYYDADYGNSGEDWLDAMNESEKELKRKYPQFKDLIDGFSPHEHIYSKESFDKIMKMKPNPNAAKKYNDSIDNDKIKYDDKTMNDPIRALLNNDFFFEANPSKQYDIAKKISNATAKEMNTYLINKYGSEIISAGEKQKASTSKAIIAGTFLVPTLLAGGIGALIYTDLKNK